MSKEHADFNELSKGKASPISIWNEGQAMAYYEATEEVRAAWNRYAQAEADIFDNNPNLDSYDSVHTHTGYDKEAGRVTPWAPPLTFKEFMALRFPRTEPSNDSSVAITDEMIEVGKQRLRAMRLAGDPNDHAIVVGVLSAVFGNRAALAALRSPAVEGK